MARILGSASSQPAWANEGAAADFRAQAFARTGEPGRTLDVAEVERHVRHRFQRECGPDIRSGVDGVAQGASKTSQGGIVAPQPHLDE